MHWVVLVYISMFTPTKEVMKYKSYEFPVSDFQECREIARQINDIETAYKSKFAYVRGFYWVYNNVAHEIKAECVYATPPAPFPEWFKRSFNQPVERLKQPLNQARTELRLSNKNKIR